MYCTHNPGHKIGGAIFLFKNHLNQKKLTKCSENEYNASKLERLSFFIKYRIN
ncbi:hypothetical protein [Fusobacterium massiliense]|uniref:hypothetical protein n=1 Tax=Fusobacterium massiliense TaxID=1852365 RepID=UPI00137ADF27|nr:hypothetical protein [Fusobacterium massiliense]